MDNPETQATLGTRLKNEMLVSFDKTTIISIKTIFVRIFCSSTDRTNIRENRRDNQTWIIQRHKQHWTQDTKCR
jgi:hypothetical protein